MRNILTVSLILLSILVHSQDFNKKRMDSLFSLLDKFDRNMGSISIFQDGREVYANSIGFADVDNAIKANATTLYRIGSISKTFTAVLTMQLVESTDLSLDQKLDDFYPEIPSADQISIEHLLRHQSGIFNITNEEEYLDYMTQPMSRKELINKISSFEREFEAGEKTAYSNSNYILLTFILEDITKKSYAELLKEKIIDSLSLTHTAYGDKIESEKNEAYSYTPGSPWILADETDLSIPLGAGGIVSTPSDLNLFLHALFNEELISSNSLDSMMELKGRYGMGLFPVPFYDKKAYGHTGGIDGFVSNAFYFPNEKVAISYTSNAQRTPVNNIMIGVLSIYFGKDYEMPKFQKNVALKSFDLDDYLGVYSSPTFPLKITITKKDNVLYAQATGQPEFALEALGDHQFQFEAAKLKLTFQSERDLMIFEQMGGKFELSKEEE